MERLGFENDRRVETMQARQRYFAWQAFGRRYAPEPNPSLPPYLQRQNFDAVRSRCGRVRYVQRSFTDILRNSAAASFDRYACLTRKTGWTMRSSRRCGPRSPAPRGRGRGWSWHRRRRTIVAGPGPRRCARRLGIPRRAEPELGRRDRSSIYGGFHLYTLKGA